MGGISNIRVWSNGDDDSFPSCGYGFDSRYPLHLNLSERRNSMSLNRVLKVAANKTYSGWDFNGDGMFNRERDKEKDKRISTKHQRTQERRWTQKKIQEMIPL